MIALLLNSGMGTRMGELTKDSPKCMTKLCSDETIISRQLKYLSNLGITKAVITTGPFENKLKDYCNGLFPDISFTFVNNPEYRNTNYIYSMFLAKEYLNDDIVLMHGDLVFEKSVLKDLIASDSSCAVISSNIDLPEKDFKAKTENGYIRKIAIDIFEGCYAFQPLYKINCNDFILWMKKIEEFCKSGNDKCYAENAFNEISDTCLIKAYDVKDRMCCEIDSAEDLKTVNERLCE